MRFVFVMDPMAGLAFDRDTTFALQRAAQARRHQCLHCEITDLTVDSGECLARVRPLVVVERAPHFRLGEPQVLPLSEVDAVFVRKDPPFDAAYLHATLLLERARGRTLLVNDPRGLRDANEKLYVLHFAGQTPRTLATADRGRILAFVDEVGGRAVIKPLDGCGGSGVLLLAREDRNCKSIVDHLTCEGRRLAMVQEYLPAVRQGDKRIVLLDGEVLGAINRVPREDDLRANMHVGGRVEATEVSAAERQLVAAIAPRLRADGLYLVGIDAIGERLTEVNVTSPTGIQEASRLAGRDLAEDVIAWAERRATLVRAGAGTERPAEGPGPDRLELAR